jgi:hypothetical protein
MLIRISEDEDVLYAGVMLPGCSASSGRGTSGRTPGGRLIAVGAGTLARLAARSLSVSHATATPAGGRGAVLAGDGELVVSAKGAGARRDDGLAFGKPFENLRVVRVFKPELHGLELGPVVLVRLIDAALTF